MKRRSCKKVLLAPLVCTVTATPIISTGCVYLDQFEQIGITDDNLFFSPNNWLLNKNKYGHEIMSAYPGGAYIKVVFYGNTIGLNTYCVSSYPKRVTFACYIDDNKEPIVKSLSQSLGNILIFANNLSSDQLHTAKICIRSIKQASSEQNRFVWPDEVVVQNILIEKNKTLVDANVLSDFVKEKSVLIYGDDYLEAQNVGSDLESNAMLWEQRGYEYSVVAWTGAYVTQQDGNNYAPQFFNVDDKTSNATFWNQYRPGASRINQDNKFFQRPDLIIVNLGLNDALSNVAEASVVNGIQQWIKFVAGVYGNDCPPFLLQMPYLFNKSNYQSYRTAYTNMYKEIYDANIQISLMDLSEGADLITFFQSDDKIHPNVTGYENLKELMALALTPTAPTNFNVVQGTSLQIVTTWSQNVQEWKYQIKPVITHYEISYCVSGTANWQSLDPTPYNPSATSPYSFSFKVSETGNYDVRIEAKNAITDQSAEIIQTVVLSIYE